MGIGITKSRCDGCVEVGQEEAEPRGRVGDVTEAASDGLHVKDELCVFVLMPFVG